MLVYEKDKSMIPEPSVTWQPCAVHEWKLESFQGSFGGINDFFSCKRCGVMVKPKKK
jgi:hypothetical protein